VCGRKTPDHYGRGHCVSRTVGAKSFLGSRPAWRIHPRNVLSQVPQRTFMSNGMSMYPSLRQSGQYHNHQRWAIAHLPREMFEDPHRGHTASGSTPAVVQRNKHRGSLHCCSRYEDSGMSRENAAGRSSLIGPP
jgi:hypothetical protein